MSRMTLEEKIGQMSQIERSIASTKVMKKYFVGKKSYYNLLLLLLLSMHSLMLKIWDNKCGYVVYTVLMYGFRAGSVLSGGGSVPSTNASPQTWIKMVNDFQKGSMSTRLGIPMIYGIDAVHGHNNVYKSTIFPHNVGLGVTRQAHNIYAKMFTYMIDMISIVLILKLDW
ncbi:hypothetical protein CsSME_00046309 [Camellia sinensis var. sinensis]